MSFEYTIRFQPADRSAWDAFVAQLSNPKTQDGWEAFSVELTQLGIYFCDNGRSAASAVAFRCIVDYALSETDIVAIEET